MMTMKVEFGDRSVACGADGPEASHQIWEAEMIRAYKSNGKIRVELANSASGDVELAYEAPADIYIMNAHGKTVAKYVL